MLPGGIDVFYIDESHDQHNYVVTALTIPMIRPRDGVYQIAWKDQFDGFRQWRKDVAKDLDIPANKELHGVKLASARGNFLKGKHNFSRAKASSVYRQLLSSHNHLPDGCILSAASTRSNHLYGSDRLEAAMYALFQRMRTQCSYRKVNAIVFLTKAILNTESSTDARKCFCQRGAIAARGKPDIQARTCP